MTWDVKSGQGQKELELFEEICVVDFFHLSVYCLLFHNMCVLFAKKITLNSS